MLLRLLLIRDGKLLNLENDAKLPARAAWLTQGDIWWRQDLFFDEMVKDGSERRQYHQWYGFFESQLKKTSLAGNLESHVHSEKKQSAKSRCCAGGYGIFRSLGTVHA